VTLHQNGSGAQDTGTPKLITGPQFSVGIQPPLNPCTVPLLTQRICPAEVEGHLHHQYDDEGADTCFIVARTAALRSAYLHTSTNTPTA